MSMLERAVEVVAPWQTVYENSTLLSTSVIALHLTALLIGGGLAIAADRSTLRVGSSAPDDRQRQLAELGAVHRPVLAALTVLFVSGVALTAADLETYLVSPVFWVKFGFIVLLLVNGVVMTRTEGVLRRDSALAPTVVQSLWRRMRASAWTSIALWIATLVLGTALVNLA